MIGQHPERMLDPRLRMRDSLAEGTRAGCRMGEGSLCADGNGDGFAQEALLEALGIRSQWMARFPHELSGGGDAAILHRPGAACAPAVSDLRCRFPPCSTR